MKTYYWMSYVLQKTGAPITPETRQFLYGWWLAEGGNGGPNGNIHPSAKFNWLNTQHKWKGSTDFNSVHVQNYETWNAGTAALVATLKDPRYADVLAALRSGEPLKHWPTAGLSTWVSGSATGNLDYAARVKKLVEHTPLPA